MDKPLVSPRPSAYRRYQPGGVIETEPERLVRQSLRVRGGGLAGLLRGSRLAAPVRDLAARMKRVDFEGFASLEIIEKKNLPEDELKAIAARIKRQIADGEAGC